MKNLLIILQFLFVCSICYAGNDTNVVKKYHAKYSTNYLINAYIDYTEFSDKSYQIDGTINIPFYKLHYQSYGKIGKKGLALLSYKEYRSSKLFLQMSKQQNKTYKFERKNQDTKFETINSPVYDFFSLAFQIVLYGGDKLPNKFYVTNGKQLYLIENKLTTNSRSVKKNGKTLTEKRYKMLMGNKQVLVKSLENLEVPYYIEYSQGKDLYKLTFTKLTQ